MANGDPTLIGYLVGNSFARGFPSVVRDFNANFLALPALPSKRIEGASSAPSVVVRAIDAGRNGIYLAVVNTDYREQKQVKAKLPGSGSVTALASGARIVRIDSELTLDLRPYQLLALRVTTP
jgi:ABC-type taurine transport system substrate-binding protein